ncbi:MAG: hypothetical protein OXC48_05835 [Endozoicomonadaceae bacterium]|nr:hypothetical protein [Endozoicomonadaceae bacterium]
MNKLTRKTILVFTILISISKISSAKGYLLEPESWSFPAVIEYAREISPKNIEDKIFGAFGLIYSSEELAALKVYDLSANELQKYADIVVHAYPDAAGKQLPDKCEDLPISQMNKTCIANVAYVSIHATNPDIRKHAAECFAFIHNSLQESEHKNLEQK